MSHTSRYSLFAVVLLALAVQAGPRDLMNTQPVELIEMIQPGEYTQRTVNIQFMLDATATVCVRALDMPKDSSRAKCFYKMHDSSEIVVIDAEIIGEVKA